MAFGSETVASSGAQDIDGLLGGYKWHFNNGNVVAYNFPTAATYYIDPDFPYSYDLPTGFVAVSEAFKTTFRHALEQYAAVIDVSFTEVGANDGSNISVARSSVVGTMGYSGYGFYPGLGQGGDVWYNSDLNDIPDTTSIGRGTWRLVMHEIGHAMGLKHPHSTDGVAGAVNLPASLDYNDYTIMSYKRYEGGPLYNTAEKNGQPQSLMMLDIQALQYIYGANFNTNSGNTVYTFDTATGQMFVNGIGGDMPSANRIYRTIWDGDGKDTYDFSNYTTNLALDLRPGKYSVVSDAQLAIVDTATGLKAHGNIFNALQYQGDVRSLIENATGGIGNDKITGNDAANLLQGGAGSDTLSGGKGLDTLKGGAGNDRLTGGANGDVLTGNTGKDIFIFASLKDSGASSTARDTITDFDLASDRIDLSLIDAIPGGNDQAFSFIGKSNFHSGIIGEVRVKASGTSDTLVLLNTDSDTTTIEASILLKNVLPGALLDTHFIL